MGDRANIVVLDDQDRTGKTAVFLYGHWSGHEMPDTLKAGLERSKERWNDSPYLARILFQEMVGTDKGLTGYGISTELTDNEYPLLVVDVKAQAVVEYPESTYTEHGFAKLDTYKAVPFANYKGKWAKRNGGGS